MVNFSALGLRCRKAHGSLHLFFHKHDVCQSCRGWSMLSHSECRNVDIFSHIRSLEARSLIYLSREHFILEF